MDEPGAKTQELASAPTLNVDTRVNVGSSSEPALEAEISPTGSVEEDDPQTNSAALSASSVAISPIDWSRSRQSSIASIDSVLHGEDGLDQNPGSPNISSYLDDPDALKPDPGCEDHFVVDDNRFAFSPGQLSKLLNPKSLPAFYALGGLVGLERGLRTDCQAGLSVDETRLEDVISFEQATTNLSSTYLEPQLSKKEPQRQYTTTTYRLDPASFKDRKRVFSDNRLPEWRKKSIFKFAWIEYSDGVLILLTIAAIVTIALGLHRSLRKGHEEESQFSWPEGVAIFVAIIIVILLSATNDWRKHRQFIKLKNKKTDRVVKVVRSGKVRVISVFDVLTGDVALLDAGDIVPVDGVLVEGHGIKCDESQSTGESDLIEKTPASKVFSIMTSATSGRELRRLDPFIISGSKVLEGSGSFLVTATGVWSSWGKILMSLYDDNPITPLQKKLNILADYIAKIGATVSITLFVVLFIKFLAQLRHNPADGVSKGLQFLNILVVAVTLIDVAVPSGLPLAVTVTLAFATNRMFKNNILVRTLESCETVGYTTTICTEQTGVLTESSMTVSAGTLGMQAQFSDVAVNGDGEEESETQEKDPNVRKNTPVTQFVTELDSEVLELLKMSIAVTSSAVEGEEDGTDNFIGSKTDTALLNFARQRLGMGPLSVEKSAANIVQLCSLDFSDQAMAVVAKLGPKKFRMFVKAPSDILRTKCNEAISNPKLGTETISMTEEMHDVLEETISVYSSLPLRTVAFSFRDFDTWPPRHLSGNSTSLDRLCINMTFLGVLGIHNPLRPEVRQAIKDCQRVGVIVRIVTGDNILTATAIAEECNIHSPDSIAMEGKGFRSLTRRQQVEVIPRLRVLAQSSPEDRRVLVKRLKDLGEIVAVTGGGVHDAPALKLGSTGFSMNTDSTEIAKEASGMVLLDDRFTSISNAILWGRVVGDSVRKFLQFQLTINISALILTFITSAISSTEQSVLNGVQLLWVNLIMDLFAALALVTDPPSQIHQNRLPDRSSTPLITLTMWKMIIGQAIYQLAVTLTLYHTDLGILDYRPSLELKDRDSLVFNTYVWMQIFNQLNSRRLDNKFNIFEGIQHNPFFIVITVIIAGVQTLLVFVGGKALNTVHLTGAQWGCSLLMGSLSIPLGIVLRLIPDELIRMVKIPTWLMKKKKKSDPMISDFEHWDAAMLDIKDHLSFIKKLRGGRVNDLRFSIPHPREIFSSWNPQRRSRSGSRSRIGSRERGNTPGGGGPMRSGSSVRRRSGSGSAAHSRAGSQSSIRRRPSLRAGSIGSAISMPGLIAGSVAIASPTSEGIPGLDTMSPSVAPDTSTTRNRTPSSIRSQTQTEPPKKRGATFQLGGSSDDEGDSSLDTGAPTAVRSSFTDALKNRKRSIADNKISNSESAIESDNDDDMLEGAIGDEEWEEWEE